MPGVVVIDNPDHRQFVATVDGERAGFIDYSLGGTRMIVRHTEVDPAYEGQGVGGALARHALDSARDRGVEVVPICPFVAAWIMRHPEYAELVVEALRGQFKPRSEETSDD